MEEYTELATKVLAKANSGGAHKSSEIFVDMSNPSVVWFTETWSSVNATRKFMAEYMKSDDMKKVADYVELRQVGVYKVKNF